MSFVNDISILTFNVLAQPWIDRVLRKAALNPEHLRRQVRVALRSDPGRPSLASVQEELDKLELFRQIELPKDLFEQVSARDLEQYRSTQVNKSSQPGHPSHLRMAT